MINNEMLIALVANMPNLYHVQNSGYRDKSLREKCWLEIGSMLKENVEDIKKRWSQLRDRYLKEKRKMLYPSVLGTSSGKPWVFLEHLRFLDDPESDRDTTTNVPIEPTEPFVMFENKDISSWEEREEDPLVEGPSTSTPIISTGTHTLSSQYVSRPTSGSSGSVKKRFKCSPKDPVVDLLAEIKNTNKQISEMCASASNDTEVSDDKHFLLSLLGSFSKLTERQKAETRMEFQAILFKKQFDDNIEIII